MYSRPSPQDFEYESDYIEALEKWQDFQEYMTESADYDFEEGLDDE